MRLVLLLMIVSFAAPVFAAEERKVIRLDALKVEGRIQKPQAFYILQRSNLNFDGLEQKENFLPNIHKAIDDKPF
ncbi:MAG: hypothetical protein IT381_13485 [Deltaproteobacteria bacterium]|nr:hypothetical protein [Deltaproteobacteria bacterium]